MRCGSATLSWTPSGTLGAGNTIMGRHRQTGPPRAQQAALLATGAATSHRRAQSSTRTRSAAVLAVGVLASGVVITAATTSWFQQTALPESRAGEPGARPADRPDAGPAPGPAPAATPTAPSARPIVSTPTVASAPSTVWQAVDQGFRQTPWNTVGAAPPRIVGDQVSVLLTGRGQRSELEPDLPALQEGDHHDVAFAVCLGRDFPVGAPDRQVIARWENDSPGPAPLDLRVRDGHLVLHGGEGHPGGGRPFDQSLGPVPTGQWVQVALRVHFSANPEKARVDAWRDGEQVLTDHRPPGGTLYPGQQSYLKMGLHRDPAIAHPAAVHFRDLRVAHARTGSHQEHRDVSSGSTSRRASSPATSVPEQRSRSSTASRHPAAEHRSSETSSHRSTSSHDVPRNTPARVTTDHSGSQHGDSRHGTSAGAGRAPAHAH
jgi:hypothetical protein